MARPIFYFDVVSVYAWLGSERVDDLIPDADWTPVFLGALHKLSGRTPWFLGPERDAHFAEIQERLSRYGLPPIKATGMPARPLDVGRAATVARREGRVREFARLAFRARFVEGRDPSEPATLAALAGEAGLDPDAVAEAIARQDVKDELREATEAAHAAGVVGVPTVQVGDQVFWGDDRLEEAAAAAQRM